MNYNSKLKKCCRKILEIFKKNVYSKLKGTDNVGAIFVMMNPGKGKPTKDYKYPYVSVPKIKHGKLNEIKPVEMRPDDTQY